jgi:hypothetical protein
MYKTIPSFTIFFKYFGSVALLLMNFFIQAQMHLPDSVAKYKVSRMNIYLLDSVGHKKLEYSAVFNPEGLIVESYGDYSSIIDSIRYEYNAEKKLAKKYYQERRIVNRGNANEQMVDGGYELSYRYKGNKIFTVSSRGTKTKEIKKAIARQKTITKGRLKWRRSFIRKIYYKNGIEYGVEKQYHFSIRRIRKVICRWESKVDDHGDIINDKVIRMTYYKNPFRRRLRTSSSTTLKCFYDGFFLRKKKIYSSPGYRIEKKGIRRRVIEDEKGSTYEKVYEYIIRD